MPLDMGRKPTRNKNLPSGMRARHRGKVTYYYLDSGDKPRVEIPLGKDYVLAVAKWAELTQSKTPADGVVTFRYAWERYLRDVIPTKSATTQKDNHREAAWLLKFFEDAPFNSIEPVHVRQYLDWRIAKVRANREKALFSHIWNFAREKGLTNKPNPCAGIKGNKETGRDVYIDDRLYAAVWECAEEPLRDALDLAYLLGQRPADILKIKRADISDGAVHVQQNKTKKKVRFSIEGELATLLKRINARKVTGIALINNAKGAAMTKSMLRGAFDRAREAAIKKYPHMADDIANYQIRDLRAKAGTDTEEVLGMQAAQDQLGHTTPTMTAHYVRHRRGKLVKPTK
jgi:integrase